MAGKNNARKANEQSMGQNGFTYISDTDTHSGEYCCVYAVEDSVIEDITGDNIDEESSNISLVTGCFVVGYIESFKLASGSVIAYIGDWEEV